MPGYLPGVSSELLPLVPCLFLPARGGRAFLFRVGGKLGGEEKLLMVPMSDRSLGARNTANGFEEGS